MTNTIRNTAIAAVAAITIAASMASPAQALSKKDAALGFAFGALAIGAAAAHAHGGHGYYGHGYHGGHRWNYRRAYKRAARKCGYRFGWHTWRWERCMSRRGF